jgi:DNA mismatch repair protein MutL
MPIRILEPTVAAQIAAGEVIERPASVVKELLENSIDAGASDIRVEIREGGRTLIRVHDDGDGIPVAEAGLAFQRHATSKIASLDDLNHLRTLGFRGEALASIAAVAQVTLLTQHREEEVGTLLRMVDGREALHQPYGSATGTVITVENLFAVMPARLKFLKQPATEAGLIQQIVTRYALAYPERRFNLVSDGRLLFQSTGSGKLFDVLMRVYGLDLAKQMLPVGNPAGGDTGAPVQAIRVSGYTGFPELHRSNRSYITLFVNRRWFQDTSIAYSVIQAYHTLLPTGRYPVAVLFLEMDPAEVDVNVHPTKAEVRFRDAGVVFGAVQRAVRETLTAHAPVPQIRSADRDDAGWAEPAEWSARREALLGAGRGGFARPGGQYPLAAPGAPDDETGIRSVESAPDQPRPLIPLLRVLGQMGAMYIVAEGPDGMYLIDQHAAHERILYEQFTAQHEGAGLSVQSLLEPLVVQVTPQQEAIVAEALDTLNEWGIEIEPFGPGGYVVRHIPAILSGVDPHGALMEILDSLAEESSPVEANREAALVTAICKRAAIKGGQPLSMTEMQEMVRQLEGCRSPRTCPHGRPTMLYLSAADLASRFERT